MTATLAFAAPCASRLSSSAVTRRSTPFQAAAACPRKAFLQGAPLAKVKREERCNVTALVTLRVNQWAAGSAPNVAGSGGGSSGACRLPSVALHVLCAWKRLNLWIAAALP